MQKTRVRTAGGSIQIRRKLKLFLTSLRKAFSRLKLTIQTSKFQVNKTNMLIAEKINEDTEVEVYGAAKCILDSMNVSKFIYEWKKWDEGADKSPWIRTKNFRFNLVWRISLVYDTIEIDYRQDFCYQPFNIEVIVRLAIINCNKREILIDAEKINFNDDEPPNCIRTSMLRNDPRPNKPNAKSIIQFEVEVFEKVDDRVGVNKLSEDFEILAKNDTLSDVTIVVGAKEYRVHKLILIARSSVFATLLTTHLLKKEKNRLTVTDIEEEVFEELLTFLYTGKFSITNIEKLSSLFEAAIKYGMKDLRIHCQEGIMEQVNVNNACHMLIVAERIKAEILKIRIMRFIIDKKNEVMDTEGFRKMIASHCHLLVEMFRKAEVNWKKVGSRLYQYV